MDGTEMTLIEPEAEELLPPSTRGAAVSFLRSGSATWLYH